MISPPSPSGLLSGNERVLTQIGALGARTNLPLFKGAALAGAIFISPYSYKIAPASPAEAQVCANCVVLRESVVSLAPIIKEINANLGFARNDRLCRGCGDNACLKRYKKYTVSFRPKRGGPSARRTERRNLTGREIKLVNNLPTASLPMLCSSRTMRSFAVAQDDKSAPPAHPAPFASVKTRSGKSISET